MVVAFAVGKRLEVGIDVAPERLLLNEIHRSAFHVGQFAGRRQRRVGHEIARRVQLQLVAQHASAVVAVKIEIAVVCQIEHRRAVGSGNDVETQPARRHPRVKRLDCQRSGIALVAVIARERKLHGIIAHRAALPYPVGKALTSAVQGVRTAVAFKMVLIAVNRKHPTGNAVGIAPYKLSGIRIVVAICLSRRIADDHIPILAVPVRDRQSHNTGTQRRQHHRAALVIADGEIRHLSERSHIDVFFYCCCHCRMIPILQNSDFSARMAIIISTKI